MSVDPKVKEVLTILGVTGFVAASIVLPGLPRVLSPFLKKQHKKWGHFNKQRLKQALNRLEKSGIIEKIMENGEVVFKLTDKGKVKLYKFNLEDINLNKKSWDGKWRLVAYDIPKYKKNQVEAFRNLLKKMQFFKLQKSLWLTPFSCEKEIEFLKSLYNLGDNVKVLTLSRIEGESAYRQYFGV